MFLPGLETCCSICVRFKLLIRRLARCTEMTELAGREKKKPAKTSAAKEKTPAPKKRTAKAIREENPSSSSKPSKPSKPSKKRPAGNP